MKIQSAFLVAFVFLLSATGCEKEQSKDDAGTGQSAAVANDSSTADMSQERLSPPDTSMLQIDDWNLKISYSAPSVRGRKIWGYLVPYEKVWRTGANEASVFYTSKPLIVEGDTLPAGRYSFFTIPGEKEWTLIFNKKWNQWGAYEYDEDKDALRVKATPEKTDSMIEMLRYELLEGDSSTAVMHFYWEHLHLAIPLREAE